MEILTVIASAEAAHEGGVFGALGVNWQMFLFQLVAFVLLVWAMSKYVYPPLMQTIDAREEQIRAGAKAAKEAEEKAAHAKAEVESLVDSARKEAADIVATARTEATAVLESASLKAGKESKRIVADAKSQIEKDIESAKRSLRREMVELVALATEKVVGKTVSSSVDMRIIDAAIKEAE